MPIIIPTPTPEILEKYQIVNGKFLATPKDDPKGRIQLEIGDTKEIDFYPQLKLMRWDNEVNFSVRLKDTEYDKAIVSFDKEKIVWEKGNLKLEYYDYPEGEGGYKMVWYLKSKPADRKVDFSLQSKGLKFAYQSRIDAGAVAEEKSWADNVLPNWFDQNWVATYYNPNDRKEGFTETDSPDSHRPEEYVDSWAIYHKTKGVMNDINGKDYKVGKFGHIPRIKLVDANGWEEWGKLNISEPIKIIGDTEIRNYSVEIPEDFYNDAVYPIKSNDTFGYAGV